MRKKISILITVLCICVLAVFNAFSGITFGGVNGPHSPEELLAIARQASPEAFAANDARLAAQQAGGGATAPVTPAPVVKKCDHEYSEAVTTEPTCKDEGVKTFICSKCGDTYAEAIPKSTVHSYVEEITTEPTCTETGLKTFTCSVCGDIYEREIDALGHDYKNEITTEPTCTEKGIKTFTCSRCNDSYTEDIPAMGHSEGEFEVTKPAGWFTVGEEVQKCTVCDEILATQVIPTQYPMWYLYTGIGVAVVLIAGIIAFLIIKKKKVK